MKIVRGTYTARPEYAGQNQSNIKSAMADLRKANRPGIKNMNGPEDLKTKAEIVEFLKDSFARGHRAIATLTVGNAPELVPFRGRKLHRLDLAFYALTHANDHRGQMVVYLRMCGIVPPASRPM